MRDAESWWALGVGVAGLIAFAGGSLLAATPRVDAIDRAALDHLSTRRSAILAGSVLTMTGAALLLWPIARVVSSTGAKAWSSLGLFSVAVWVLGFAFLAFGAVAVMALVWRDPIGLGTPTVRLLLDGAHLAAWSVSAPIGAVAVAATTAVGVQGDVLGTWVVGAAAAKVLSVAVEVVGTGRRTGWNAGGWAAGVSGYITVGWFALVLASVP